MRNLWVFIRIDPHDNQPHKFSLTVNMVKHLGTIFVVHQQRGHIAIMLKFVANYVIDDAQSHNNGHKSTSYAGIHLIIILGNYNRNRYCKLDPKI
jgi:hypothetical protein